MRYWIWWNDLIQGPFEVEELTSLKAFGEELMVCMEDRQDWLPAGRVADLSGVMEQMRARRMAPKTPPPPPPRRPPSMSPLQGEFFSEAPGQKHMLDDDPDMKGPYAFLPVTIESGDPLAPYFSGYSTNPFHFTQLPPMAPPSVIEMPRPSAQTAVLEPPRPAKVVSPRVIKQSPLPKPEPEEIVEKPIPLNLLETAPEKLPTPEPRIEFMPSLAPSLAGEFQNDPPTRWLPWLLGTLTAVAALVAFAFWYADRANTRSAIRGALESKGRSTMLPVSVRDVPERTERMLRNVVPAVRIQASASVTRVVKRVKKAIPARKVAAKLVPVPTPVQKALPGLAVPVEILVEGVTPAEAPRTPAEKDPWSDRQNEAIALVMNKTIPGSKSTIKAQAKAMLDGMHEKELIHAAETGERLFLPDKISWAALREEGARYRVYLNFLAWQATGERVQTRSYQFVVDMKAKTIKSDDAMTQQDLLKPSADLALKHNPMAVDIESILGGVDFYNKQQMRSIIVKKSRKNREEQKSITAALSAAKEKLTRAVVFFRKTYSDQALQNIAKAYQFSELLKG